MSIRENWKSINDSVSKLTDRKIDIIAVTKTRCSDQIREIILAGAKQLGENRVEEAYQKFVDQGLKEEFSEISLHLIGHLQSRKASQACQLFDWIDSVDSLKLAKAINKHCLAAGKQINVLLQVNVSGESQKYGIAPDQVEMVVAEILKLPAVKLRGLMTMAPFTDNEEVIKDTFSGLTEIRNNLVEIYSSEFFEHLSMGMSGDYEIAIDNGSTMIRVGTRLFKING